MTSVDMATSTHVATDQHQPTTKHPGSAAAPGITPAQVQLVQKTWFEMTQAGGSAREQVDERIAAFGMRVFDKLFAVKPGMKPLFPFNNSYSALHPDGAVNQAKLREHSLKAFAAFGTVLELLHTPEEAVRMLQPLLRRHVRYGVEPEHYKALTDAIAQTLVQLLDESFDANQAAAWGAVIDVVHAVVCEVYGVEGSL